LGKKEKIEKIEKIEKKIEKRLSQIINLIFMGLFHPQGVPTKRRVDWSHQQGHGASIGEELGLLLSCSISIVDDAYCISV
jgi:hypothetical protein